MTIQMMLNEVSGGRSSPPEGHRAARQICALITFAASMFAVSPSLAQRIDFTGTPRRVAEGSHTGVLSSVERVMVDSAGHILVIGGATHQALSLLDAKASRVVSSVNVGEARSALAYPFAMAAAGRDGVVLFDRQRPRQAEFVITDSVISYASAATNGVATMSSACGARGKLFVMARSTSLTPLEKGKIIQVVGSDGRVQTGFGESFSSDTDFGSASYNIGELLCSPSSGLVIAASDLYPEIRAYELSGVLRWAKPIPGFRAIGVDHPDPGTMAYSYAADSLWDRSVALFSPAAGVLALQVQRMRGIVNMRRDYVLLRTYFFTLEGDYLGSQDGLPIILAADGSRLFTVDAPNHANFLVRDYTFRR